MNNQLVSIIIPTFNRSHILDQTLDSIQNQSYKNWECIIVDDGSSDNTENLVNSYVDKDIRFNFFKRRQFILTPPKKNIRRKSFI